MSKRKGKCAGDLTLGEVPVGEEDFVIAVDGGLSYCGILNVEPDLILGDFDSVSEQEALAIEKLEQQIPERILRLPCEKDDTDTLAALKEGLKRGYTDFRIYAGTGGRFDHTLANIQCLLYLKNQEYGTSTSAFISFLLTSITQLKFPFSPFPPPPSSEFATRELFNKAILELMVSYFLEFRFLKRELEKAFIDSVNISFSYFAPWLLTYSFPSRDSFTIPMIG